MLKKRPHDKKCVLFVDFSREWLEQQTNLKQSTYALYRRIQEKHLTPALGQYTLPEIKPELLRQFVKHQLEEGRLDGRGGLSPKTVREELVLLNSILESAVSKRLLRINPLDDVRPPRQIERRIRVFSPEEQRKIEQTVSHMDDSHYLGIVVCLYTGLRLGELCALKWENINFELDTLAVCQTMQRIESDDGVRKTKLILDSAKSVCSMRTLPLTPALASKLRTYFDTLPPIRCQAEDFVFNRRVSGINRCIEPRLFEKYFQEVVRTADLPPANFHALRHTFATRCIEVSMDAKSLSEILGHSNVSMTLNRYVHSLMEQKRRSIARLDALLVD